MRTLSIVLMLIALTATTAIGLAQESGEKLISVMAKDLKLEVPSTWKKRETSSAMRAAEFEIPAAKSGDEAAELVVYYFGNATGGTKANVQRWIDQFYEDGRKHEIVGGKCRNGRYVLVSISGTYKKPDGPPAAQKTIDKPGSRVLGVVLIKDADDAAQEYYFLKLAGPEALVDAQAKALRAAMGVDPESEKSLPLDELGD